ncbi:hypothetical protein Gotur_016819 [Gossypium turneri]
MMAILVQNSLKKVVTEKKPENLNQNNRKSLMKRPCLQFSCASRIQYCRRY